VNSKFTSAGPEIAFTNPWFPKPAPKIIKIFAPWSLCVFAIKVFRIHPVKKLERVHAKCGQVLRDQMKAPSGIGFGGTLAVFHRGPTT
jgi:hypothetical protein